MARGDLADLPVEQDEKADEFQQTLLAQEADQQTVLIRRQLFPGPQALEIAAQLRRSVRKDRLLDMIAHREVLDLAEIRFVEFLLPPSRPELLGGFGRGVTAIGAAEGKEKLGIREQLRYLVDLLVADVLADPLINHGFVGIAGIGPLGLDHNQWKPVHETNQIGPPRMGSARGQHLELLRDDEAIGGRIVPVDDGDGGVMLLAVNELGDGDA